MSNTPDINTRIVICGPTACGKTRIGVELANALGAEILSADSRQVYRGMDIGTGKDLDEYGSTPFHLIDIVDAGYRYNLYEYLRDYRKAENDVIARRRLPLVIGGTGLYIESICKNISLPEVPVDTELRSKLADKPLEELTQILAAMKTLHNTTDVDTAKRAIRAIEIERYYIDHPEAASLTKGNPSGIRSLIFCVTIDRDTRRKRISKRLTERLKQGMLDEARTLLDSGVTLDTLMYYGLEYKYMALHLSGQITYDQMVTGLETAIHQFAKRQMTWFRGMERRGFTLHPLPYDMPADQMLEYVTKLYRTMS